MAQNRPLCRDCYLRLVLCTPSGACQNRSTLIYLQNKMKVKVYIINNNNNNNNNNNSDDKSLRES